MPKTQNVLDKGYTLQDSIITIIYINKKSKSLLNVYIELHYNK